MFRYVTAALIALLGAYSVHAAPVTFDYSAHITSSNDPGHFLNFAPNAVITGSISYDSNASHLFTSTSSGYLTYTTPQFSMLVNGVPLHFDPSTVALTIEHNVPNPWFPNPLGGASDTFRINSTFFNPPTFGYGTAYPVLVDPTSTAFSSTPGLPTSLNLSNFSSQYSGITINWTVPGGTLPETATYTAVFDSFQNVATAPEPATCVMLLTGGVFAASVVALRKHRGLSNSRSAKAPSSPPSLADLASPFRIMV